MKLVLLIGPPAVGKMTVGQTLAQLSGLKLFHNHIAIEMVQPFFSYGTREGRALVQTLREAFFDAFARSDAPGYIFTYVWAFGEPGEQAYIEGIANRFAQQGAEVYWVELEADQQERLLRNRSENRLAHKPSKRDLEWSDRKLVEDDETYRLNSEPGEVAQANYLRINNTQLSASEAARQIWDFVR